MRDIQIRLFNHEHDSYAQMREIRLRLFMNKYNLFFNRKFFSGTIEALLSKKTHRKVSI